MITAPSAPIGEIRPPQPSTARPLNGTFTALATRMITIDTRGRPVASRNIPATMYMRRPGSPKAKAADTRAAPAETASPWPRARNIASDSGVSRPSTTPRTQASTRAARSTAPARQPSPAPIAWAVRMAVACRAPIATSIRVTCGAMPTAR